MNYCLGKENKLCSPKIIDDVFATGYQVKSYPFVLKFKETALPKDVSYQIVFSAPKRTFRKATQRNRIKRLCKEAFRHHKQSLDDFLKNHNKQLALFFVYTPKEELSLSLLGGQTDKLIKKIISQLESNGKAH
jgi:ribonuclease P protein component